MYVIQQIRTLTHQRLLDQQEELFRARYQVGLRLSQCILGVVVKYHRISRLYRAGSKSISREAAGLRCCVSMTAVLLLVLQLALAKKNPLLWPALSLVLLTL